MNDLDTVLASNASAVADLIAAAEASGPQWLTPRVPGKWSPSQIVEHVARALEESANEVAGAPSKFPNLPSFLRPLLRVFLFNRVLQKQAFPKAKTNKAMDPVSGPATPAEGRARLQAALASFEQQCRIANEKQRAVQSRMFGAVSVKDYVRFQSLHTRHHLAQMGAAPVNR